MILLTLSIFNLDPEQIRTAGSLGIVILAILGIACRQRYYHASAALISIGVFLVIASALRELTARHVISLIDGTTLNGLNAWVFVGILLGWLFAIRRSIE